MTRLVKINVMISGERFKWSFSGGVWAMRAAMPPTSFTDMMGRRIYTNRIRIKNCTRSVYTTPNRPELAV